MTSFDFQPPSSSQSTFFRVSASSSYSPDGHGHEFVSIIDSLGRIWNSLHHPRDRYGRFIRTFSTVKWSPQGRDPRSKKPTWTGRVEGVDKDGSALVNVTAADPGNEQGIKAGDWVRVMQNDLEVQKIKGKLGRQLTSGPQGQMQRGIKALQDAGLTDQAARMQRAYDLGMDKAGDNDEAINIMRDLAEELDGIRGEGYAPGTTTDDLATSAERGRAKRLDNVIATLVTARHDLSEAKDLGFNVDQGDVKRNAPERRQSAAYEEISAAAKAGIGVRDFTKSTTGELIPIEAPVDLSPRDQVLTREQQNVLPGLRRGLAQKGRTGLDRAAGIRQRFQVAPKDRYHVDKNGDVVVPGSIVNVDAANRAGGRKAFTGLVTRINTKKDGVKQLVVRDFDPTRTDDPDYVEKGYKDYKVDSKSLELAPEDLQDERFQNLALSTTKGAATSAIEALTKDYLENLRRRYAMPGAKKLSWSKVDATPPDERTRPDMNGQIIRIGDQVVDPNGAIGLVTNITDTAGSNTVTIQYPNAQENGRLSSRKLLKTTADPTSKTSLRDNAYNGGGDFLPTRAEAAEYARSIGADSVADAIENEGDIKAAMISDEAFQAALKDAGSLWDERESTLSQGKAPSQELVDQLAVWDALAVASADVFRDPDQTVDKAVRPKKPEPVDGVENPQDPTNPDRVVTPGGSTIRKDENGKFIVNEDTEDPKDTEEEAQQKAAESESGAGAGAGTEATAEETTPAKTRAEMSSGERIASDARRYADAFDWGSGADDQETKDSFYAQIAALEQAVADQDADAMIDVLTQLKTRVDSTAVAGRRSKLKDSNLGQFLTGKVFTGPEGKNTATLLDVVKAKNEDGTLFEQPPAPEGTTARPGTGADETPEGVSKSTDTADNELSKSLLSGDAQTFLDSDGNPVESGFAVLEKDSVVSLPEIPTQEDIANLIEETGLQPGQSLSIWRDPDGTYRAGAMSVFDTQEKAASYAASTEASQFVDISDGQVYNTALPEDDGTVNSVADDRAKDRNVSSSGEGKAKVNGRTSKQQRLTEQLKARTDADPAVAKALDAIIGGDGEISAEEADALSKYVSGLGLDAFEGNNEREKASSKGVAQALADRISQAAGKQDARAYASTNTALRRSSDVSQAMKGALSSYAAPNQEAQIAEISSKLDEARQMIKDGNLAGAATLFDQIADLFEGVAFNGDFDAKKAGRRAREHAARLRAGGGGGGAGPQGETPELPTPPDTHETPGGPTPVEPAAGEGDVGPKA